MHKIAHIWFDMDGTLYNPPAPLTARIFNEMYDFVATRKGLPLNKIKKKYDKIFERVNSHTKTFEELGLRADDARATYNRTDVGDFLVPDRRLEELFQRLDSVGVDCSIYSNNYTTTVDLILRSLCVEGPPGRFKHKLTGESFSKTSDAGYELIIKLSTSDVVRPKNILFVGDREEVDISPAKKHGLLTALVVWPPQDRSNHDETLSLARKTSSADFIIPDIYSITDLLQ